MKTIILCGGLGTRLREETEFRPKPMVQIGTRPILWHIMKLYAHYNHKDFILALGYKGEMIKEYFYHYELMNNDVTIEFGKTNKISIHNTHNEIGWKVTMVDTGNKALKGARLKRVEDYITEDMFMVTYGDCLSDLDINSLIKFHKKHGKLATVTGVNPTARFGELKVSGNKIKSFAEKPKNSRDFINGGFFVFNREILKYLSKKDGCDLEVGAMEEVAKDGQLMVYKHRGFWACMDTLRDMDYLNRLWDENKASWRVW